MDFDFEFIQNDEFEYGHLRLYVTTAREGIFLIKQWYPNAWVFDYWKISHKNAETFVDLGKVRSYCGNRVNIHHTYSD